MKKVIIPILVIIYLIALAITFTWYLKTGELEPLSGIFSTIGTIIALFWVSNSISKNSSFNFGMMNKSKQRIKKGTNESDNENNSSQFGYGNESEQEIE
jgi:hypothetical protein